LTRASTYQFTNADSGDEWVATGGSRGEPADYCSKEGAIALKAKIEAYWRERGQDVMIALHNVGFHPAIRAARYDVRSDMVNGLPRARNAKGAAAAAPPQSDAYVEDFDMADEDLAFE
jgi:hypothetical protein